MERTIFHIDVNSAFLSWEAVERLANGEVTDIRQQTAVIGGDESNRHGIVLAKSQSAKKFGIRTGESLFSARTKCPDLVVYPSHYSLYIQYSNELYRLLSNYAPVIQRFSVDECFLDYTGMQGLFGEPEEAAHTISGRIKKELGYTVNIGISTNKILAKMASDFEKPDKIHTLYPQEIRAKMWPLPVRELFMVGAKSEEKLKKIGITTIGQLACCDPAVLRRHLKSFGIVLWEYANGIDNDPVVNSAQIPIKSVGNSTTTKNDVTDAATARSVLLSLVETASGRLRRYGLRTGNITVSIKNADFKTASHGRKMEESIHATNEIFEISCYLFFQLWKGEPLRSIGVSLSDLTENSASQLSILDINSKSEQLSETIDSIRKKFGNKSIMRSRFLENDVPFMVRGEDEINANKTNII